MATSATQAAETSTRPIGLPAETAAGGARPPRRDEVSRSLTEFPPSGPAAYNQDNQPAYSRSGLNSDPDNPNGAPGEPPRRGM